MGPERAQRRVNNTLHRWTVNKHHPLPPPPPVGWTELQWRVVMGFPALFRELSLLAQLAKKESALAVSKQLLRFFCCLYYFMTKLCAKRNR